MTDPQASTDSPQRHRIETNGIALACHEWRADRRGAAATLLMAHATGFHGRVWDPVVRRLPGRHVLAPDLRGHGGSDAAPFAGWETFGRDLAGLAAALDLRDAVGIGHSMGAHALVQAAAFEPGRFSQLVLIDPVLLAPTEYLRPAIPAGTLHPAAGRRNRFESPQAMFDRFAGRQPYALFDRQVLHAYCTHALRPAADGEGFELACAPAFEAAVYPQAHGNPGVYASIRALRIPVLVVRARDRDLSVQPWDPLGSPTWAEVAAEFRHGIDLHFADKTHFLPMEDPALVAQVVSRLVDGLVPAGA